jgi:hypothetical protein
MDNDKVPRKKAKRKLLLKILIIVTVILSIAGFYVYNNFNNLLTVALMNSFNSNVVSDVYELKFEKLRVNLFEGNINVFNVIMSPREKPLKSYPYINSSFILKTKKIELTNVQIMRLLRLNELSLDKIEIDNPEIQLNLEGKVNILFPVKEKIEIPENKSNKKFIDAFTLKNFNLTNAAFKVKNHHKEREFEINGFNISLDEVLISQQPGMDKFNYKNVDLKVGSFAGIMNKGSMKIVSFNNFKINFDSFNLNKTLDTLIYGFKDFNLGIESIDVQTADSIFHLQLKSFDLSYKNRSVELNGLSFKPNMSFKALQKNVKFSKTDVAIDVGILKIANLDFDSLLFFNKVLIDNITIENVSAKIYKDNTKLTDKSKIPGYLGQQIKSIPIPVNIKQVEVKNVSLENTEIIRDSNAAIVYLKRGNVIVKNICNYSDEPLTANVEAFLDNKVHFNVALGFDYQKPQFSLNVNFGKFNLPDMNAVINAYTPAKINKGVADQINFYGTVFWTHSAGTMKFLYHDLDVALEIKNKAKWKSVVGEFAANTYLPSANPASEDLPPRIVKYDVERKMNSGFINLVIRSGLTGLKETMLMSKENRKNYKEKKREMRKKAKVG